MGDGSAQDLFGTEATPGEPVMLPHDASIRMPREPGEPDGGRNGYFRQLNVCYTKVFELPQSTRGRNVYIEFEGVYQNATVTLNRAFAGRNVYGHCHSGIRCAQSRLIP